jgi:hypothetical protein
LPILKVARRVRKKKACQFLKVAPSGFNSCNLNKKLGCGKVCRAQEKKRNEFLKTREGKTGRYPNGINFLEACQSLTIGNWLLPTTKI